ncbi:hypothetical protein [Mycoplasma bradburyae]|uniref:Uncharacterized protein n=1 Tax=Mycoplasma bradburyae TaxID=2963128 RepID=A0AAW6HRE9_9MOLU|nr:hypothetical protein [Mycoplasma bradburyae]MDC4183680.1 hypothetical protein [Mycoplasma bradburyae]
MKKAYKLLNILTMLSTVFLGSFSFIDNNKISISDLDERISADHGAKIILRANNGDNASIVLDRDRTKNTVESVKKKLLDAVDYQFQKYYKKVEGWVQEFDDFFKDLYRIEEVQYVRTRNSPYYDKNLTLQEYIDKSSLDWASESKSSYEKLGLLKPITDFGYYNRPYNVDLNFEAKYIPKIGYTYEFTNNYSRVKTPYEVPKYEQTTIPLENKILEHGFVPYKKDTSLNGVFSKISGTENEYYALTNLNYSSDEITIREHYYRKWQPTFADLDKNNFDKKNIKELRFFRWKIRPIKAYTHKKFTNIETDDFFPKNSNGSFSRKRLLFFWKDPTIDKWRIINNSELKAISTRWSETKSNYKNILERENFFDYFYGQKYEPKTISVDINHSRKNVSPKYNIFADYFTFPYYIYYKGIHYQFYKQRVYNGWENLVNLFVNNLKINTNNLKLKDNYVFSRIDQNLKFGFSYNDRFLKLIDHLRKIGKYKVSSWKNKFKNLAIDYADLNSIKANPNTNYFDTLIETKGLNYVSQFQKELFSFLGITVSEIDDTQYDFLMKLPELFDFFNNSAKLIGDVYVGSNKISDRVLMSDGNTIDINLNSSEITNIIPPSDLNRNFVQIKINNLRIQSSKISEFNGKSVDFSTIENDNRYFKIDDVSLRFSLNYRYDFLNINFKNSIKELNDFNVRTYESLYAEDFDKKVAVERSIDTNDILIDVYKSAYQNSNSIYINQDGVYSPRQNIWTKDELNLITKLANKYNFNLLPNNITGEFWLIIRVLNGNDFTIPGSEKYPELIPNKLYFLKNDENIKSKFYLVKFKAHNKLIDINKSQVSFENDDISKIKLSYLNNDFVINLQTDYENNLVSDQTINLKINDEFSIKVDDSIKLIRLIEPLLASKGLKILNNSIQTSENNRNISFTLYSLDKIQKTAFNPITNFDIVFEKENNNIFKIKGKYDNNTIFNVDYKVSINPEKVSLYLVDPKVFESTPVSVSKDKITELIKTEINKFDFIIKSWDGFDASKNYNELLLINPSSDSNGETEDESGDISRDEIFRNDRNISNENQTDNQTRSQTNSNNQSNNEIKTLNKSNKNNSNENFLTNNNGNHDIDKKAGSIIFDLSDKKTLIIFIVSISLISLSFVSGLVYGIIKLKRKNKLKRNKTNKN